MMDDITPFEKRKQDMMQLWKETFHDSDRYIRLVFDTYFTPENSFVRYHENRLIAAMLCVDYEFQILTKEGALRCLRGLYLCGLATRPEWRRKGIMGRLMEEAESTARQRGYDMTFLIPADDHLRHYYGIKGYQTASWRKIQEVVNSDRPSEAHSPNSHIYTVKKFFEAGKIKFLSEAAEWCSKMEASRRFDTIVHSREDFLTVMAENENSIFLTDTTFDPEFPILAKVKGIVFPEVSEATEESLSIVGLFVRGVPNKHEESLSDDMTIQKRRNEKFAYDIRNQILSWFDKTKLELLLPYSGNNWHEGGVEPYAMLKIFNGNINFRPKNEILNIEISLMLD